MKARITNMLMAFGLWMLLTWSVRTQDLVVGAVFSVLVGLMVGELLPGNPLKVFDPRRWFWFVLYLPYFAFNCTLANFDMAYRVLNPRMPIRPGVVRVRTSLTSDMGRVFLANSITLMPGTHVVDVVDQHLYVHWVNVRGTTEDEHTRLVVKSFEFFIRKIFE